LNGKDKGFFSSVKRPDGLWGPASLLWGFFTAGKAAGTPCLPTPEYQTNPAIDQIAYMDAGKYTIKLHVQVFLKMNTWMFEACRRHYN
jgi:hypothetical protein